jgi:hypothetical protein
MGQKFAYPVLFLKSCKRVSIPVKYTPLLHKDVVESTACPHQKAVSTFLPPAQAPPKLPARREQRGIISNGVNLSAEFNATTG